MKIFYTKHATDKLKEEKFITKLKIDKKIIEEVVRKPEVKEKRGEKVKLVRSIDKDHSLVVVYRKERKNIIIITFFPASKGRYETKILQRG